jgi:hypothetical protein
MPTRGLARIADELEAVLAQARDAGFTAEQIDSLLTQLRPRMAKAAAPQPQRLELRPVQPPTAGELVTNYLRDRAPRREFKPKVWGGI